jgi:hypothetical protein
VSVEIINLHGNYVTGMIPSEFGQLSRLDWYIKLDLSYNRLSGTIPSELGKVSYLDNMKLYNNSLSGNIPSELGKLSSLKTLGSLSIAWYGIYTTMKIL